MFKTIIDAFKIKDVRRKILFTLLLLLIYRIGCWLPIPGVNPEIYASSSSSGFLGILSAVSGGSLSNGAILALGVIPYINASIIIQLLSIAIPRLQKLSKEGEAGKKKINLYTKIAALILAAAQAIGIVVSFGSAGIDSSIIGGMPSWIISVFVVIVLIAGAMFTVWLGDKITDLGIGNGLSLLIFVGILSTAGTAIFNAFAGLGSNIDGIWTILGFFVAVILIFGLIVWVDSAERRVNVQYAKQIKGRKMFGGQSTYIPIRVNGSGVMPIIFATAIISFPQLLCSMFWSSSKFYAWYSKWLGTGSWVYAIVLAVLILFFSYFYAQLSFNPEDISKQIQQDGGFITGIRPGKPTVDYLKKVSNRITLFGAIFLAFIALVPTLIFTAINSDGTLVNAFSATGMLIVVSVALEFNKQLESQMLMRNYKGFLK